MSNALRVDAAQRAPSRLTAPFATGVWWDAGCWIPSILTTILLTANTIYVQKLKIPRNQPVTRVFGEITVAAAAGKLIRFGLTTVGSDGLPDALIYDTGSLAADVTGDVGKDVAMVLPYDEVWSLALSDGAPTMRAYTVERAPQFMGWRTATSTTKESSLQKTQAYGALPATFGAPTSYVSNPLRVGVKS